MAEIRLYKKFLCITASSSAVTTNEIFDPFSLSAITIASENVIIESALKTFRDSTGIYYVDLNPNLYSGDITYQILWNVIYIPGAPIKQLPTKFRILPNITKGDVFVEVLDNNIDLEIEGGIIDINVNENILANDVSIEIITSPIGLDINNNSVDLEID